MNDTKRKQMDIKVIMTEIRDGQNDYVRDLVDEYNDGLELDKESIENIEWFSCERGLSLPWVLYEDDYVFY